ncbi:MAG: ribosome-binding protein aMBF1 (putative translation factor) [Roseivirga sp.]|jgi:ribosome-binding protein aMBF1 (putative translation factor)
MSKIEEKLKKLAAENPVSDWKKQIEYRKANKGWLRKSGRVALRVLDALDEKGWSQAELARQLEVSPQQITKIVKGQSDFKFSTIDKLEKVLGIQLQAILMTDEVVVKNEEVEEEITTEHNYSSVNPSLVMQVTHRRTNDDQESSFVEYDADEDLREM